MTGAALGILGFFAELEARMNEVRHAERDRLQQFFVELNPALEAARKLERELDRHLAHRFNVFDYMGEDRPSELLLSRIIGDLLNPAGRHGQGTSLLGILLEELTAESGPPKPRPDFSKPVRVRRERVIAKKRLIDITVDVATGAGPWCLAFENKPYADDQRHQVWDYLKYLEKEYEDRFLLIYLSPRGEEPTAYSLPREALPRWCGRLVVMPYWGDLGGAASEGEYTQADDALEDEQALPDDVFADFRTRFSLADWFAACRARSQAERLRWFFRDAEAFCQQQFGGHSMATGGEAEAIRDHLFSNPEHLKTALTVHDAWPSVKAEVCKDFLDHLRTKIHERVVEELPDVVPEIRVEWTYDGQKRYANFLWVYRVSWSAWANRDRKQPPHEGCTAVMMEAFGHGPNRWVCGVFHPLGKGSMTDSDKQRRTRLEKALRQRFDHGVNEGGWWPYQRSVRADKANWDSLISDLYREGQNGGGPIADYYVDNMVEVALKAIPAIDEVERTG